MSEPPTTDEENESPRAVRITFIILAFAAGCLLLPPRQWYSAGAMGVVTLLLAFIWRADLKSWWEEGKDDPKPKAVSPSARTSKTLTPGPSPVNGRGEEEVEQASGTASVDVSERGQGRESSP